MKREEYIAKYRDVYSAITGKQAVKAQELIEKLADVLCMMDECKAHIEVEGCVSEMCQGNYSIERENPWSRTYDNKSKIMLSVLEKLDKMLPTTTEAKSDLMDFIKKTK